MRLFFALLGLLALLTAGAYGVLRGRDAPGDKVEADIGEAHFSFDPAYARDESTAVGGLRTAWRLSRSFPTFRRQGAWKSRRQASRGRLWRRAKC